MRYPCQDQEQRQLRLPARPKRGLDAQLSRQRHQARELPVDRPDADLAVAHKRVQRLARPFGFAESRDQGDQALGELRQIRQRAMDNDGLELLALDRSSGRARRGHALPLNQQDGLVLFLAVTGAVTLDEHAPM